MDLTGLKYIAIGLSSIAMLGAALGVGKIFSSLIRALSRNPSVEPQLTRSALIGAGLVEAMGLFAFLLAILLIFFVK